MLRLKQADERRKGVDHARKVAPVTLFVESLRGGDEGERLKNGGYDPLRPWYASSEMERSAAEARLREAKKKIVLVKRRGGKGGGVQLVRNTNGDVIHADIDPLDEMKQNLKDLDV